MAMSVPVRRAWCGRCGEGFTLDQVLRAAAAGRCPRCERPFAASYDALVVSLVRDLVAGTAEGHALADLTAMAPCLHIEPVAEGA